MARPFTRHLALASALAASLLSSALLTGCAADGPETTSTASNNAPTWIDFVGLYDEGNDRAVYAVGASSYNPNVHIRRQQATARGRAEIARTLRVMVQSMVEDYVSSHTDFYDMDTASSVEMYEEISRLVTDELLIGSKAHEFWKDPIDGVTYALMKLDFDSVVTAYREQMNANFERQQKRNSVKASRDEFEQGLDEQIESMRELQADAFTEQYVNG